MPESSRQLPRVTVVTPSYNQGQYLEDTIRSVLEQDYPNIELIVMDGGSTDNSVQVLRKYDGKIQWISEKDGGQSDAINKGFARSSGEIFTWLNSDDMLKPGAVRQAVEFLQQNPRVDVVYGDAEFVDRIGRLIGPCSIVEPFSRHRLRHYCDFIVQPASFIRRHAFAAVGGVDVDLHYTMDYDLFLKLADRFEFAYVRKNWAQFRWFGINKSATGGRKRMEEVWQLVVRYKIGHLPAYFCVEESFTHLTNMRQAASARDIPGAIKSFGRAIWSTLGSKYALASLFTIEFWKVIWTGSQLRRVVMRPSMRND